MCHVIPFYDVLTNNNKVNSGDSTLTAYLHCTSNSVRSSKNDSENHIKSFHVRYKRKEKIDFGIVLTITDYLFIMLFI